MYRLVIGKSFIQVFNFRLHKRLLWHSPYFRKLHNSHFLSYPVRRSKTQTARRVACLRRSTCDPVGDSFEAAGGRYQELFFERIYARFDIVAKKRGRDDIEVSNYFQHILSLNK